PRQGLYRNSVVSFVNPIKAGDAVDVDQVRGPGQAEIQQRDQGLPAGQHLGVLQRGEQRESLIDSGRAVILELSWFHSSRNATARQRAASPPWKRHGKQPNWIFWSSTSSIC